MAIPSLSRQAVYSPRKTKFNLRAAFNHLHDIREPHVSCSLATAYTPYFISVLSKASLVTRLEEMEVICMK